MTFRSQGPWVSLLFSALAASPLLLGQVTNVINDGTAPERLTLLANRHGTGGATLILHADAASGALVAEQSPASADFPLHGAWYDDAAAPATNSYRMLADVRPVDGFPEYLVGAMGWIDAAAGKGIGYRIAPSSDGSRFQMTTIDFFAETADANDSTMNLFNLDGTAAQPFVGSAWADAGAYQFTNPATVSLEFTRPTEADLAVVTNATARVTGRVFQDGGQVGGDVQLLTTLPVPVAHRFGYYASWATFLPGAAIGYFDNLRLVGAVKQPPSVRITSPSSDTRLPAPATFTITAEAQVFGATLVRIEFLRDGVLFHQAAGSPASVTVTNATPGTNTYVARAIDSTGATGQSAPVTVEVVRQSAPPVIALVSPTNNATFVAPANVTLTAEASDPGGQVRRVDFLRGDVLLEPVFNPAPTITITDTGLGVGDYTYTARAVDDESQVTVSAPVTIHVVAQATPPRIESLSLSPSRTNFVALRFTVTGLGGSTYTLQSTTNVPTGPWVAGETGPITSPTREFTVPRVPGANAAFYRIAVSSGAVAAGAAKP